jgi:hypothetical protein
LEDSAGNPMSMGATKSTGEGYGMGTERDASDIEVDLTKSNGRAKLKLPAVKPDSTDGTVYMAVRLDGVTNAEPHLIHQLTIDGAA